MIQQAIAFCKYQHDVECNQKYNGKLPYSFHLEMVAKQAELFNRFIPCDEPYYSAVIIGCWGHDLIEDARMTYNDVKAEFGTVVADIIYACTEEKGHNRNERHSEKYFTELAANDLAVLVKLFDIIANIKFSILTNSSMAKKYKKEYPKVKEYLYTEEYADIFTYIERLLNLIIN